MVTNKIWLKITFGKIMEVKEKFIATVFFSFMPTEKRSRWRAGALHSVTILFPLLWYYHRVISLDMFLSDAQFLFARNLKKISDC